MTKTVLITDFSTGTSRETARTFLNDGWTVYATARDRADIEALTDDGSTITTLDVTDTDDAQRIVNRIISS